ncbi:hypothetical protein L207DRAFT_36924 [Hyaloscypha variabilis F]|uniref:Uncharacterized protein n=1 Tax=Hyaloscypha variabilis (strain UAMH 11265 / GT02V1 / F) TaxID=1149755 RepID=A0A2J6RNF7_HYAVF|nr:hypothetical protein L207DRAFT_36924 [Hyaloscypha variabilis F]
MASRERAVTTSSYASTAKPSSLDKDLGLSLGGDFSEMFAGFDKRKSTILDAEKTRAKSQSPEIMSLGPASRFASSRTNAPSSITIDRKKEIEPSPYSWSSQHSRDGLITRFSPTSLDPSQNDSLPPPPVPAHGPSQVNSGSPSSFTQVPRKDVGDNGLKRTSAHYGRRQSTIDDSMDEDARLLKESANANQRLNDPGYRVRDSWALPSNSSYKVDDSVLASWETGSKQTTPKAKRAEPREIEDNMFDGQIAASANIAQRFHERQHSPPTQQAPRNRVMTPAQFERYKQDQERLRSVGGQSKDDEDEDETYDDDEDDAERARQLAKQRRKQEAHMSVYRQQMMKVTGDAAPTRPSMFASQSSPNLLNPVDGEEEDEEIPLAILQAHGFPNKNKPPMRNAGSNPNLRASSVLGGSGGSPLPVFARSLPQDPYIGAGLVNPMHRESLAFGGGSGSVSGEPSRGLPPGGLVGVIATEERSRAMRRGSPNAQGIYGPPPSNGFNGMQAPPSVTGSMYNGMGPAGPMGPMGMMNPMMMTPGDQAQIQMSQQMQQFMAMQMQFMQMMTSGQGPPVQSGHQSHNSLGEIPRPASVQQIRPGAVHQRAMTMLEPNAVPWMNRNSMYTPSIHGNGGYTPSIAPSERSNVGMPGRYRPVSQAPPLTHQNKFRTSTMMSGGLGGWQGKQALATIRPVKKSGNPSDEDDEEGWEEMAKKREKKKSSWRTKKDKDPNGLKEMLAYTQ